MKYEFEEIVDKYYKDVYRFIFMMVKNRDDAEDITQDTFLRVKRYLWTFRGRSSILTWIYRIATNEVKKFFKKANKINHFCKTLNVSEENSCDTLSSAMKKLDYGAYEILFLKYFKNMSEKEIAFIVNVPEGTVKSRLFNARKKLKEVIENG
ncbi:MAG: RNA polymerase sigma factor [Caldisericota bacterium]|nr:RNA polymerase sigma factor [Caldisericota bacterium]